MSKFDAGWHLSRLVEFRLSTQIHSMMSPFQRFHKMTEEYIKQVDKPKKICFRSSTFNGIFNILTAVPSPFLYHRYMLCKTWKQSFVTAWQQLHFHPDSLQKLLAVRFYVEVSQFHLLNELKNITINVTVSPLVLTNFTWAQIDQSLADKSYQNTFQKHFLSIEKRSRL